MVSHSVENDRPQSHNATRPQLKEKKRAPYVSFGGGGTTASAGTFGSLLRVSRYIDRNDFKSKIIALDSGCGEPAYLIASRAGAFLDRALLHDSGFGIRMPDESEIPREPPTLTFLHDRWPVITYRTEGGFRVQIQLSCHENTIVQQVEVTNEKTADGTLSLVLDLNFCLQDLDYMSYVPNIKTTYGTGGPDNCGIVATGASQTDGEQEHQEPLSVLITLFQKDILQDLGNAESKNAEPENSEPEDAGPENAETDNKKVLIPIKRTIGPSESIKFAVVFTLQFAGNTLNLVDYILAGNDLDMLLHQGSSSSRDHMQWPFPDEPDISWHLRRNLEHILSVCSLPLPPDNSLANDIRPVALTCGDFGDHRVCVSGSYFAFKFMLAMYKQLPEHEDPGLDLLRTRIHEICRGHLLWISQISLEHAFSSNLWVNGRVVSRLEEEVNGRVVSPVGEGTDLPPDTPANMASHILKATEYLEVFKELSELIYVFSWLKDFISAWLRRLRDTKNKLTPTWQHAAGSSDIPLYRLGDQIWVWKALQDVEKLVQRVDKEQHLEPNAYLETVLKLKDGLFIFRGSKKKCQDSGLEHTAEDIRRQNLIRFTVYNDILRRRMLSVTRTTRETRYLFHSRDTILYYGDEWGFFNGDRQPLWHQLVKAQIQHEDEAIDEDQWGNPLRYALAITMSFSNHRLDRSFKPEPLAKHAKRVIMNSSSENGLFPGQLDADSKEPLLFESESFRDFYFHCGFEIPFILFRTAEKDKYSRVRTRTSDTEKRTETSRPPLDDEKQQSPLEAPDTQFSRPVEVPRDGVLDLQLDGLAVVMQRKLKRRNPYGRLVDLSNIVEIPDEWLYKYPDFLGFDPPQTDLAIRSVIDDALYRRTGLFKTWKAHVDGDLHVLQHIRQDRPFHDVHYTIVGSVRKGRSQRKQSDKVSLRLFYSYPDLWARLSKKRTAEGEKKRLLCLAGADSARAGICYLASPDSERAHIAEFFKRHAQSNAFVYDDTAVARNSWVTEVHFRFYQLDDTLSPRKLNYFPVRRLKTQSCLHFLPNTHLVEAAIGFRIVGDFFDRYWTCHSIEDFAGPQHALNLAIITHDSSWQFWRQRKILELTLFNRILNKVCKSAEEILEAVGRGQTEEKAGADQIYPSKNYFENRSEPNLHECFQILMTLKNNLSDLQRVVLQWKGRESACGKDRPRWTRNDEERYAKHIKRNQAIMESHIMDLTTKEARTEFMMNLVTNSQEANRSIESLREARHITAFTYVTVFFLPLGFAVGVFGMEGVPGREVITSMAITAVVALVITASVLSYSLSQTVRQYIQRRLGNIWKPSFRSSGTPPFKTSGSSILPKVDKEQYEEPATKASWVQRCVIRLKGQRGKPSKAPSCP